MVTLNFSLILQNNPLIKLSCVIRLLIFNKKGIAMSLAVLVMGLIATLMFGWVVWSWYELKTVDEPAYTVAERKSEYEIRIYKPYITVQVTMPEAGEYFDNQAFRKLFKYITGFNVSKNKIPMTVPVFQSAGQSIKMTAPVLTDSRPHITTMAFVMPAHFTFENTPIPQDKSLEVIQNPERKVAVLRFGWYPSEKRALLYMQKLHNLLIQDGIPFTSTKIARYNPPFAFPLLMRNEIWAELK